MTAGSQKTNFIYVKTYQGTFYPESDVFSSLCFKIRDTNTGYVINIGEPFPILIQKCMSNGPKLQNVFLRPYTICILNKHITESTKVILNLLIRQCIPLEYLELSGMVKFPL
jgi:hypothetical protein